MKIVIIDLKKCNLFEDLAKDGLEWRKKIHDDDDDGGLTTTKTSSQYQPLWPATFGEFDLLIANLTCPLLYGGTSDSTTYISCLVFNYHYINDECML